MKTAWVGVPRRRVWTFPPQLCQVGSFLLSPLSLAREKGGWKQVLLQNMSRVQGRPQNSPVQQVQVQIHDFHSYVYQKRTFNQVNKTILNILIYKYSFIIILNKISLKKSHPKTSSIIYFRISLLLFFLSWLLTAFASRSLCWKYSRALSPLLTDPPFHLAGWALPASWGPAWAGLTHLWFVIFPNGGVKEKK